MKTFLLGVMAGAVGVHLLTDTAKKDIKKSKKAIMDKLEDILG